MMLQQLLLLVRCRPCVTGHAQKEPPNQADVIRMTQQYVERENKVRSLAVSAREASKPVGALGVLSHADNVALRNALRTTWARRAPFEVQFLLDRATPLLLKENSAYSDIVFLNTSYSGRAVRFGDKLIRWLRYASTTYPNADWVGKCDDDVFIHTDHLVEHLRTVWNPRLYYGWVWKHGNRRLPSNKTRVDEALVIVGSDLVSRLIGRRYCDNLDQCDLQRDLYDTNYGGTSLGIWLSAYHDVSMVALNSRMILHYKKNQHIAENLVALNGLKFPEDVKRVFNQMVLTKGMTGLTSWFTGLYLGSACTNGTDPHQTATLAREAPTAVACGVGCRGSVPCERHCADGLNLSAACGGCAWALAACARRQCARGTGCSRRVAEHCAGLFRACTGLGSGVAADVSRAFADAALMGVL